MKSKKAVGWAWKCDFGLCYWIRETRKELMAEGKPSSEARPVKARIVEIRPRRR